MKTFRIHQDNLDELLFEHRNKEYGAYELRKSYHTRVIKSFCYSILFLALLIGVPLIIQYLFFKPVLNPKIIYSTAVVDLTNKIEINHPEKKYVRPALPPAQQASHDAPIAVVKDSLIQKDNTKMDTVITLANAISPVKTGDVSPILSTGSSIPDNGPGIKGNETAATTSPVNLAALDIAPEFPGGESSLTTFLQNNIHYNARARSVDVTGHVYASFIINSKGEVKAIKILRGLGYGLDEEVIRVLELMPLWKPGFYHGQPVSSIMNIPVSFSLVK